MEKNLSKQYLFLYRNKGSILVVTIWVLVFFAIMVVGLYRMVSPRINLARALEQRVVGQYLAKAAVLYVRQQNQKDQTPYDTLYELSQKAEKQLGGGEFIYYLIDEESKININTASVEVLGRLPGLSPALAQSITGSTLRPFHVKEELLLIDGITEEIFNQCRDFVTVYTDGEVNINTAPAEVLKALGFDDNLVGKIGNFRKGSDNKIATEDDGIFENTGDIVPKLSAFTGLTQEEEALIVSLVSQGLLGVEAENFSVEVETELLGRKGMRYSIITDKEKIKQWREL